MRPASTGGGTKRRPSIKFRDGLPDSVSCWGSIRLELLAAFSGGADVAACWGRALGLGPLLAFSNLEGS